MQKTVIINVSRLKAKFLYLMALLSIMLLIFNLATINKERHPRYNEMVSAAQKVAGAITICQDSTHLSKQIWDTGYPSLIGMEFSPITTTIGNLEAKKTALNPDFAALFINWFDRFNLQKDDKVVIQASGSFPTLAIAAIISCETFGLEPVIFSSAGASSFGANHPEFTYWDIEALLFQAGRINHKTILATPGAENDNGSSFWEGGMEIVKQAAKRNGYDLIIPQNLNQAVAIKYNYIKKYDRISLFINIGGNQSATGSSPASTLIPSGLITEQIEHSGPGSGLIHILNRNGIPVINMLQIKNLAAEHQIALSPVAFGDQQNSGIYFRKNKPDWITLVSLLCLILTGLILRRRSSDPNLPDAIKVKNKMD